MGHGGFRYLVVKVVIAETDEISRKFPSLWLMLHRPRVKYYVRLFVFRPSDGVRAPNPVESHLVMM